MTELEGVKGRSRGSRRRLLRWASLRLALLDRLGLVSRALLVPASSSAISSAATTSSLTITLLLFEGWLVWPTLNSAQLLSLVPRGFGPLPLFPCKTNGLAHVGNVQRLDLLFLAEELGEPIEGRREFGHDQHRLEVVGHLKPRRVASGEVSCHLVYGDGGVLVVGDLDVHGRFEFEVGGDDTRLPILFLKVIPEDPSSVHGFGREVTLDLGSQSEHHVSDGFLVIILPILDFLLVGRDLLLRRRLVSSQGGSSAVQGDVPGARSREYTPLTLRHKEALHRNRPGLVIGAGEDRHKGSEAGRHFLVRLVRG